MAIHASPAERPEPAPLPRDCRSCPGWKEGLCALLAPEELRQLAACSTRRRHPAGTELISAWTANECCGMLLSGVAKSSKMLTDGRQQIVALTTATDFVGRPFAAESTVSLRAVTDVEFCSFQRSAFEAIVARNHGLEHRLHVHALNELDRAQDLLLLLGRKTAREKVATFIGLVADAVGPRASGTAEAGADGTCQIELPFTRAEIADFLGLTFETVSRQFAALKREGIVDFTDPRRITVADRRRLTAASGS